MKAFIVTSVVAAVGLIALVAFLANATQDAEAKCAELTKQLDQADATHTADAKLIADLKAKVSSGTDEAKAAHAATKAKADGVIYLTNQVSDLQKQRDQLAIDLAATKKEASEAASKAKRLADELPAAKKRIEDNAFGLVQILTAKNRELLTARDAITVDRDSARKERDSATVKANNLTAQLAVVKQDLTAAEAKLVNAQFKLDHATCPAPDYSKYTSRIAELEDQLADLRPKKKAAEPAKKTKLQAAIDEAARQHKLLAVVYAQDKCLRPGLPCWMFNRNVLDSLPSSIDRYVVCELNVDHDDIGAVTVNSTPAVGIYSPEQDKWIDFFAPQQSVRGFLGQLAGAKTRRN